MKTKKILCLLFLFVFIFTLSACEDNSSKQSLSVAGGVYIDNAPLVGVDIRTSERKFATTNDDGKFSFEVKANSITIYPEKSGYIFEPQSITLNTSKQNIVFEAHKIVDLNGTLSLDEVIITPTSITTQNGDYVYSTSNSDCLKIKQIHLYKSNRTYDILSSILMAPKNKQTSIEVSNDDVSVNTCENFSLSFGVDAYYKLGSKEYLYTENEKSTLTVTKNQTNADLVNFSKNATGQIVYTMTSINSSNNNFTYTISFVFDFYPN